ncbi:MAG: aldo/keto reductase, partial [Gemmatimonadota bacterium]|nr:aldo/keto reductase [Gemmatimonadota bacterium]
MTWGIRNRKQVLPGEGSMPVATTLEKRNLGYTGASVGLLGLGGNRLLTKPDRRCDAVRMVRRALDLGVTFFDTARLYPNSEAHLGEGLEGRRDGIFLASKT